MAPVSSIISRVNSSALEAMTSAALSRSVRRSPGPVSDQAGKAAAAALDGGVDVGDAGRRRARRDLAGERVPALEHGAAGRHHVGAVDEKPDVH